MFDMYWFFIEGKQLICLRISVHKVHNSKAYLRICIVMIQVAILLQKLNVPEKQHTYIAANVVKKFFQQMKKEYKLQSTQNCFLVVL